VIVGHLLRASDNDSYMYLGDAEPPRCASCGVVSDPRWVDPGFQLPPGKRLDASFTYDGRFVVSDAFRAAAKAFGGAEYAKLPSQPGWSLLLAAEIVRFDVEARGTKLSEFCPACSRFTVVAGATPVFLIAPPKPLPDVFLRTDVEFGTRDELRPLVLVGPGLADALIRARLTGLNLTAVDVS
jgi:hypothetical protein